jgi:hypothetical protein
MREFSTLALAISLELPPLRRWGVPGTPRQRCYLTVVCWSLVGFPITALMRV